jgi:hypothetical protein
VRSCRPPSAAAGRRRVPARRPPPSISNKQRISFTEVQLVQKMIDGASP